MTPRVFLHPLLLFAAALALYLPTLRFGYVFDDKPLFVENPAVHQGFRGIPALLGQDLFSAQDRERGVASDFQGGRYRPLLPISVAIEVGVSGGLRPWLSHAVQALLYALCCLLVASVLRVLYPDKLLAVALGTWLFLAHPLHAEIVANIKSRDELLCLIGMLGSCRLAFRRPLLSAACMFLALLAKEYAVFLFVLVPLWQRIAPGPKVKIQYAAMLAATALALGLRLHAVGLGGSGEPHAANLLSDPFLTLRSSDALATQLALQLRYLRVLLFPHPLAYDYSFAQIAPRTFASPLPWLGLLTLLAVMGLFVISCQRRPRLAFALGWVVFPLLLVSNLFLPIGTPFADRFLFLPSFGLCLVLGRLAAGTRIATGLAIFLVLLFSLRSLQRTQDWQSEERLYLTDVETVPNNVLAQNNAAAVLLRRHEIAPNPATLAEAEARLRRALQRYPDYPEALLNLGLVHLARGDLSATERVWQHAHRVLPDLLHWPALHTKLAAAWCKRSRELWRAGDSAGAETACRKALRADPRHLEGTWLLTEILRLTGRASEAAQQRHSIPGSVAFPPLSP